MRRAPFALVLAALACSAGASGASDDACFRAAVDGQKLRREGKLGAAREAFVSCGQKSCDAAVVERCAGWLREVETAMPSITLAVRDAEGRDVKAVGATLDGADASAALGARGFVVDPGSHRVVVDLGTARLTETILVREGEKNGVITFRAPASIAPSAPPVEAAPPSHAMLYGSIAAGSVAVAGGALFAVFSAKGLSDRSTFGCADGCSSAHYDTVHGEFLVADVALGVALGSLALATTLFLLRPKAAKSAALVQAPRAGFTF